MEVYKYHSNITQKRHGASRNYRHLRRFGLTYDIYTLPYTFDHIWTNLLTQCTPVPVSVFCCFCISGFPITKTARKIPEKLYKKSAFQKLPGTRSRTGGGPPGLQAPWWRGPPPGRTEGGAWAPQASADAPLWHIFNTRRRNPDSGPLFSRRNSDLCRHRHQASGDQNSCAGTLPGRGSAPGFISIDVASSLHDAGVVPPRD